MNRFAYGTTGLAIKTLSMLLKARVRLHDEKNIPEQGSIIFVINHFTRVETLLLPYHLHQLTRTPVWSLGDYSLFKGAMGNILDKVGVVSTRDPDRDLMIVKSLLTGEAAWIIFPEGLMVKNKKIVEKGRLMLSYAGVKRPPHTGAATIGLRTEFYRKRLTAVAKTMPQEAERLMKGFGIESLDSVITGNTAIVPVNITYYPIRGKENLLTDIAALLMEDLKGRALEEMLVEGTLLFTGADVDIRFGPPIHVRKHLKKASIEQDIHSSRAFGFDDPIPSKRTLRKVTVEIMEQYMREIYRMTTVNHDHLFASVLKFMPKWSFDPYDLRRRVYMVAAQELEDLDIFLHNSLRDDQLHLLTDDRFRKFSEFIELALEKKIVIPQKNRLIKDRTRFTSPLDLHQVRIDNPISVIANEIEPLPGLQRLTKKMARTPTFWMRRKLANHFFRKAVAQFEADFRKSRGDSASQDDPDTGRPFLIPGSRFKKTGVLLIHGYMAAPLEVASLAIHLSRKGLTVYGARLPGHGTSPKDLATRSYEDWIRAVEEGYAAIQNLCDRVIIGGFSTGGMISLNLASRIHDIAGVFAISPPLRLQDISDRYSQPSEFWGWIKEIFQKENTKEEFLDHAPENPEISYSRNPVSGMRAVEDFMEDLEPRLEKIRVPVMIIHSRNDTIANPKGSKKIFERIRAPEKRLVLFDFNRHCIILGDGSERVHRTVAGFIEELKGEM